MSLFAEKSYHLFATSHGRDLPDLPFGRQLLSSTPRGARRSRLIQEGSGSFNTLCAFSLLLLLCLTLFGCGGGYPGGVITMGAASHAIDAGQSITLQADVTGSVPTGWTLTCAVSNCGSLSGSGNTTTYTAPSTLTGTLQVTATATISGTSRSASSTITVNPSVQIVGTPTSGTVGTAYSYTLTTSGGTGTAKLQLASGSLPDGLTFDPNTGIISGTPTAAGTATFVVHATDQSEVPYTASATETLTVAAPGAPLSVASPNPPNGTVGIAYSATLTAAGGTSPYTWGISSGALPPGLTLDPTTGAITGSPTTAGTYTFTAQVTDANGATESETYSVTISPAVVGLSITAGTLADGTVGVAYQQTIPVSGGTSPYSCTITAGVLPAGLSLSSGCVVSGTPTVAGTAPLTVQVTDSSATPLVTSGPVSITIQPQPVALTIAPLPIGTVGTPYTGAVTPSGGTAPYKCALASGSLPAGLTLNQNCAITGTPTTAGPNTFAVQVTDSSSPANVSTGNANITIEPAPVPLTVIAPPPGTQGSPYTGSIGVTGGTPGYKCTLASGSLPAGLTLGQDCSITGTPTGTGTSTFSVQVTDSANPPATTTSSESMTINPTSAPLTVTAPPAGAQGTPYAGSVGVTGGTPGYKCTLASGSLPAGLTLNQNCTITGTPTGSGTSTFSVTATDSSSPAKTVTTSVNMTVSPIPLTVTAPPSGTQGTAYTGSVGVTGGTPGYKCTLASGSLPAGLTLGQDCSITGTPTGSGTSTFSVQVTDSANPPATTTSSESMTINPSSAPLTVTAPPSGTQGSPYTGSVGVTGGTPAYKCTLASGTLPTGLTLNQDCSITGTPTGSGISTFSVTATDSSSPAKTATTSVNMTISPIPLTVVAPPPGTQGSPYTGSIGVTGGTAPYKCTISSGSLPAGLTMDQYCNITGTPTGTGTSTFTVTVTDSANPPASTSTTLTMTVNPPPALALTGSLPNAIVGVAYTQTLTATGGIAPYSYAVTSGSLPDGLSLSSAGVISGTPTTAGAVSFTVTATDSEGTPATASLPLVLLVTYPATTYDSLLQGPYAYLFQGYDDAVVGVLAYHMASVGSFTADGAGVLTMGEQDTNHQGSNPSGATVPTESLLGTYTIDATNNGTMTISTLNTDGTVDHTTTYAITVKTPTAPATVSSEGSFIETDGISLVGQRGSGSFQMQTASAFASGLTGSYAFGLEGDTSCLPTCTAGLVAGPAAAVGQFTTDGSGNITSGEGDTNISAQNYPTAALSGNYTPADGNGRVQLSLTNNQFASGAYPVDYAVYMIDASHAFVMSTDKHSQYILLAGSATQQTTTTFSNTNLQGHYVGYENAPANPGVVDATLQQVLNFSTATIFSGNDNGTGSCTTTHVDVGGLNGLVNGLTGVVNVITLAGQLNVVNTLLGVYGTTGDSNCTVATNGRAVLNYPTPTGLLTPVLALLGLSGNAPAPRVAYLTSTNTGYFLETSYAGLGRIENQTGPFTVATFDGTYVYESQPAASLVSIDTNGSFTADGAGHATTTLNNLGVGVGSINVLNLGAINNYTYTLNDATAGRYLLGPTNTTVVYAITPNRYVLVDTNALTTSPSVALLY